MINSPQECISDTVDLKKPLIKLEQGLVSLVVGVVGQVLSTEEIIQNNI